MPVSDNVVLFSRETNLKVRQALPDTAELGDDLGELNRFNGEFCIGFFCKLHLDGGQPPPVSVVSSVGTMATDWGIMIGVPLNVGWKLLNYFIGFEKSDDLFAFCVIYLAGIVKSRYLARR